MPDYWKPDWFKKRKEKLHPKYADINDIYKFCVPQYRWIAVGENITEFKMHLNELDKFCKSCKKKSNKKSPSTDFLTTVMNVFHDGEKLILRLVGIEETTEARDFMVTVIEFNYLNELAENNQVKLLRYLNYCVTAGWNLVSKIEDFFYSITKGYDNTKVPNLSRDLPVEWHIREARDLITLGYHQAGLFTLYRLIEIVLGYIVSKYENEFENPPPQKDDRAFAACLDFLKSTPLKRTNRTLLDKPMINIGNTLRDLRNIIAHWDEAADSEFIYSSQASLAELALRFLEQCDKICAKDL